MAFRKGDFFALPPNRSVNVMKLTYQAVVTFHHGDPSVPTHNAGTAKAGGQSMYFVVVQGSFKVNSLRAQINRNSFFTKMVLSDSAQKRVLVKLKFF